MLLVGVGARAQLTGLVFKDYNGNGIRDSNATYVEPLWAGITVNAYNASGALIASQTTLGTGTTSNYAFPATGANSIPAAAQVRIEFVGLSTGDYNSVVGTQNASDVQFVTAGAAATANYAINAPDDYWKSSIDPLGLVVNNRWGAVAGDNRGHYSVLQIKNSTASGVPANSSAVTIDTSKRAAMHIQTGALFGLASQRHQKRFFASAIMRRAVDLGPKGAGGVYIFDLSSGNYALTGGFTLQGVTPSNSATPLDFGTVTRVTTPTSNDNFFSGTQGTPMHDLDAFVKAGKASFGDIEGDPNTDTVYMINLLQRNLIVFNAAAASASIIGATAATLGTWTKVYTIATLPGMPAAAGSNDTLRPFAVKIYKGIGYLGVVSDASSTKLIANLKGWILKFDPKNISAGVSIVATIDFSNYENYYATAGLDRWHPWIRTYADANNNTGHNLEIPASYAQPEISSIEFNEDESMNILIRDRWGDQGGNFEYIPTSGSTTTTQTRGQGDMLHACKVGTSWILEGTPASCPQPAANLEPSPLYSALGNNNFGNGSSYQQTGKEWYSDVSGDGNPENNSGGGTKLMGTNNIIATVLDPIPSSATTGSIYFSTAGIQWNNVKTGAKTQVARTEGDATLDKGQVMGDIEMMVDPAPIQIGNRIWLDANGNGIQDANETTPGVPTATTVTLRSPGVDGIYGTADDQTWTTATSATGTYYFDSTNVTGDNRKPASWSSTAGILPGYPYQIEVTTPTGFSVTPANSGSNDHIDNDAVVSSTKAIVAVNTLTTNHTLDFGFMLTPTIQSLGDKVWRDDNKDGKQDVGEPGVAGVTVTLYSNGADGLPNTADDNIVGTTVTDAYGKYLFYNIPTGSYNVGFTLPANYTFTSQGYASNPAGDNSNNTNSDPSATTGRTGTFVMASSDIDTTVDAGLIYNTPAATASIGDRVWLDVNNDGVQGASTTEPGISGVTVSLLDNTGKIVASTITDANGAYLFTNVTPGTYNVQFTAPPAMAFSPTGAGTTSTDSDPNPSTGKTAPIVVTAGTSNLTIDAGLSPQPATKASLGDKVWNDINHDGVQNANEPGIPGVTVTLYAADGTTVVSTTTTDAFGNYNFNNLTPGSFVVGFTAPTGYTISAPNAGTANLNTDSDPSVATGKTALITLAANDRNMSIDAGMYLTSPAGTLQLGDKVFYDLNKDGIQGATEIGAAGVTVTLYQNGPDGIAGTADDIKIGTTLTDVNGNYLFTDLAASAALATNYNVLFSNLPAGYSFSSQSATGSTTSNDSDPNPATGRTGNINLTATNLTIDAGLVQGVAAGKGSIGDKVWYDLPITGNTTGVQDPGETGAAGVTVKLYQDLNNDGTISGAELTPIATTTTDGLGYYQFGGLDAGNYQVGFSNLPTGFTLTTTNVGTNPALDNDGNALNTSVAGNTAAAGTSFTKIIQLAQGEDNLTIDAGIVPPSGTNTLGNFVWLDANKDGIQTAGEPGIPGVSVTLYNNVGAAIATTSTDANGYYLFANVADGTYSVGFSNLPSGMAFTTASATNDATGSDASVTTGKTTTVTLGASDRNDASLDAGLVTTTTAAIGDYVWYDANRDGIQDATETGISGVTVSLYRPGFGLDGIVGNADDALPVASMSTDANGKYLFDNLVPGTYQVGFTTIPTNLAFTKQNNVGNNTDNTNSDAVPATGLSQNVTLAAGDMNLTIDAGLTPKSTASVGDYAWYDKDRNGVQGATESGAPGVVVVLKDASGNTVGSAVTDGNGKYLIPNVPEATGYTVTFSSFPGATSLTTQTSDLTVTDATLGSDPNATTGVTNSFAVVANTNNPSIDAGLITPMLGDKVWRDDNKDGKQDVGEPGVSGVTVTLYDNGADGLPNTADDIIKATTVTDAYGKYLFKDLTAGNYNVGFTLPANYTFSPQGYAGNAAGDNGNNTNSDPSTANGRTGTFVLSGGEVDTTVDAGLIYNTPTATASVGDRVWLDVNNDGVQGATTTEPGISGVAVTLLDNTGKAVATTLTDANGAYLFTNVVPGTYSVQFTSPAGMIFSPTGAGTTATDSDPNPATGKTSSFTVTAGTNNLTIDAGLSPQTATKASLGDYVWNDLNHNGVQDAGEPGIGGVTVTLYDATGATVQATTTTDAYGNYTFNNLAPASYVVGFTAPTGYTMTTQNAGAGTTSTDSDPNTGTGKTVAVKLLGGDRNATIDAGMYLTSPAGTLQLGDKVFYDVNKDGIQGATEDGVPGVTVTLYQNGPDGIAGTADDIKLSTTATDKNGNYLFTDLAASASAATNYNVGFSNIPSGYSFTGQSTTGSTTSNDSDPNPATGRTNTINLTATNLTIDAGVSQGVAAGKGSLGDKVWYDIAAAGNTTGVQDPGEQGVAGVTVNLYQDLNNDGTISGAELTAIATTTTDGMGNYLFGGLDAGTYQVGFSNFPAGYTLTTTNAGTNPTLDNDGNALNTSVAGNTAAAGTSFTKLIALAQGEDNFTIDAGIVPPANTNSLGNYVWLDANKDGLQTAGEQGIPGVTVTLYNTSGTALATTSTDATGKYLFAGLPDGNYSVGFSNLPAGLSFTNASATNDATGSDANVNTGMSPFVSLGAANRNDVSLDAGLITTTKAALGNYVWLDANRDGIQDATEVGISGVTVSLYRPGFGLDGVAGNGDDALPVATMFTDANGAYLFDNLVPGTYQVGFTTVPSNLSFTKQNNVGSNTDNTNSDAVPATGLSQNVTLAAGDMNLTIDAGLSPKSTASVGDYVWLDADRNGVQGATELGVPGVIVVLKDNAGNTVGSAVTDGKGKYLIPNVPEGTGYTITFSNLPPAGSFTTQTSDLTVADVTLGSDPNASTGVTNAFNVVANTDNPSIDAGIKLPVISGTVFDDANALVDGIVNGVTTTLPSGLNANLVDANGNVVATAPIPTTGATAGTYSFPISNPGTYTVQISTNAGVIGSPAPAIAVPSPWFQTGENTGLTTGNDGTVDGKQTVTVTTLDVPNVNFGIEQPPTADPKAYTVLNTAFSPTPATGYPVVTGYQSIQASSAALTGYAGLGGKLSGTDPEDCSTASSCNTAKTFKFGVPNANTKVYYNNGSGPVLLTTGTLISNFDPTKLVIYGQNGSGTVANPVGFTYALVDAAGVASPLVTYTITVPAPLPIDLISFSGKANECLANLNWSTAHEANVTDFDVLRSEDGIAYETVANVAATGSNSNYAISVQNNHTASFKLKINEGSGQYTYSNTIQITSSCEGSAISLYPNPAKNIINLKGLSSTNTIQVYDMYGRQIQNLDLSANGTLNISSLVPGSYTIQVTTPGSNVQYLKFVKL